MIVAAAPTAPAAKALCNAIGCKSSRIRKDCSRQRCKAHCIEFGGGCFSPAHKSGHSVPTPIILQQMQPTPDVIPPSSLPIDPVLITASVPSNPSPPAAATSSVSTSRAPAPVHASHMAPVFTEQWATEQRIREEHRKQAARRLIQAQRVKHTVYVYVWDRVCFIFLFFKFAILLIME